MNEWICVCGVSKRKNWQLRVLVSDRHPCPTQNNLWPFRTLVPISRVAYHFACHLSGTWVAQWSLESRVVWTRHHAIIEEKHGLMNPFDVCLPLRCPVRLLSLLPYLMTEGIYLVTPYLGTLQFFQLLLHLTVNGVKFLRHAGWVLLQRCEVPGQLLSVFHKFQLWHFWWTQFSLALWSLISTFSTEVSGVQSYCVSWPGSACCSCKYLSLVSWTLMLCFGDPLLFCTVPVGFCPSCSPAARLNLAFYNQTGT